MDFTMTPEEEAFRTEVLSWLEKTLPEFEEGPFGEVKTNPMAGSGPDANRAYKAFQKRLYDAGYAGMNFPKEYGGQGRGMMDEVIVKQCLAGFAGGLTTAGALAHALAAPTILHCGNEAQKKEFLPKLLDGTHNWCQGFSEPDAGSDVAGISTSAVKDGDHYVVNGQKVWSTNAQHGDYCILVVQTDPKAQKHRGLSYLLCDMTLPGIEVVGIPQITKEPEFNEIFFNDVRVPADMLVGNEGDGWKILLTTLMFERTLGDVVFGVAYEKNVEAMLEMANTTKRAGLPVIEDPILRQEIAKSYIDVMVLKYHGLRNLSNELEGGIPGPEGSIGKILWSEPNQRITESALSMQGPGSQVTGGSDWSITNGFWQYMYLRSKGNTIEAGTSEIQRNIIGERVLGLPKDSSRV